MKKVQVLIGKFQLQKNKNKQTKTEVHKFAAPRTLPNPTIFAKTIHDLNRLTWQSIKEIN